MVNIVIYSFFLYVSTLLLVIPQFVKYLSVFLTIIYVFGNVAYLVLCGTESELLAFATIFPSSHSIVTSLCYCSVDHFIPAIIILRYDCKPALNIVFKKLFVVNTCKP
jgi:hypothetical protein